MERQLYTNGGEATAAYGPQCFGGLSIIANQLFAILRLALPLTDLCNHFRMAEGTYNRTFTTWICFLSKKLLLIFPFPTHDQVNGCFHHILSVQK